MAREFVDAIWAKEAVQKIDPAIADWNALNPGKVPITIAWDSPDQEVAQEDDTRDADDQIQQALINWGKHDFEASVKKHGDPAHPNYLRLSLGFKQEQLLPLKPRELYNVLHGCDDGVCLRVSPDPETPGITVWGVQTAIPVEGITGRLLFDALARLVSGHGHVFNLLAHKRGDDWWEMGSY